MIKRVQKPTESGETYETDKLNLIHAWDRKAPDQDICYHVWKGFNPTLAMWTRDLRRDNVDYFLQKVYLIDA